MSEVSCEKCTHTAIAAQKIGDIQRDIGGIGLHQLGGIAMGLIWDCHVIAMGLNIGRIAMRCNSGGINKEFTRMKIPL